MNCGFVEIVKLAFSLNLSENNETLQIIELCVLFSFAVAWKLLNEGIGERKERCRCRKTFFSFQNTRTMPDVSSRVRR